MTATTQHPFQASADSLDPTDWNSVRQMGHRMLDDMVDMLAGLREAPVWQLPPLQPRLLSQRPCRAQPQLPKLLPASLPPKPQPSLQ